ncbi:MAG TPA: polysaccharide pyruvyl transferase family protein [Vicinamibacterales bacterium]
MHILIDSGSYHCLNVGDVAMLQAAIERFRILFPEASIAVVTNSPENLAVLCPGVEPIPLAGRVAFLSDRFLGRADMFVPAPLRHALTRIEDGMRRSWPEGLSTLIAAKRALALRSDFAAPRAYIDAINRADLVVATGAGVFTDAFVENAIGVLTTLDLALRRNIHTAAVGQGLGPVSNDALKRRMADVLTRVDLIALRERRESVHLLDSLGVPADRVAVTGDDAIEMANRHAPQQLGTSLGVNVRLASYAGTSGGIIDVVGPVVTRAASRLDASLTSVPIAHHPDCHDGLTVRDLIGSGAEPADAAPGLRTPDHAMAAVSRCRVVVTGSYHGAVFALAQGIPVVAIAASPYYFNKFAGLAELFEGGCTIVSLVERDAAARLESAIDTAWAGAPAIRESLLQAARVQIEQGRAAYRRLADLVRRSGSPSRERRSDHPPLVPIPAADATGVDVGARPRP